KKALPNATFDLLPIGDGGEGTLETLTDGLHLRRDSHIVTGALGQPVEAHYATNGQLAVFEMADICGLEKVPLDKRNPLT
ncbi:glycerate kinase, partial [Streptococcus anginosus]